MTPSGLAVLLKPAGMTSFEVVSWARRRFAERRVGHAGTLDPAAAGVMVVAVGTATRWLSFLDGTKGYVGEVAFGRATSTGDATGTTLLQQATAVTEEVLRSLLPAFTGTIRQRPPAVSAVRIEGRRAHERVRSGEVVVVPEREVRIEQLELLAFDEARQVARLAVTCSAGTYIRSLAEDLGRALEVPAHLSFLVRTRAGAWTLADAEALDEEGPSPVLWPVDTAMAHWPRVDLDAPDEIMAFRQGKAQASTGGPEGKLAVWHLGRFAGLARMDAGLLRPERVVPQA
ncbi:MAG: tRNA pseudouridine(55) synthase TruB [Candidatus Sericytochromatia bacterium]|nr:tRNA pseudouridine(55) synthase TruB [Candidatus Sericytochromatia bacterium]